MANRFFTKKYSAEEVANILQNMDSNDVAFTIGLNIVGATNRISTSDNLPLLHTQNETKINVPKSDGNQENEVGPTTPNKQRNQDHGDQSYEENTCTHARTRAHAHTHTRKHTRAPTHTRTHTHVHTYTHAHARTHTHTHACTHAHTHTNTVIISFSRE